MKQRRKFLLLDIYNKFVKKADKHEYADLLKTCTESLFIEFVKNDFAYTATDIKYSDGYFIYGTGTNTVVNFHLKEIPGWLFGIWWDIPNRTKADKKANNIRIKGQLFAQYEDTIDKFKPSRSNFLESIFIVTHNNKIDNEQTAPIYTASIIEMFDFIRKEPMLAFCRDYIGWDYNREYHTRDDATKEFNKYMTHKETELTFTKAYDAEILKFILNLDMINEELSKGVLKIRDNGEFMHCRYDLVIKKSYIDHVAGEDISCGTYSIKDIYLQEYYDRFVEKEKELEGLSYRKGFCWMCEISSFIYVAEDSKFNKIEDATPKLKETLLKENK